MVGIAPARFRRGAAWISADLTLIVLILASSPTQAHRSGCHRWHSCESDRGTYVCGDLGYCSACPDNQFCLNVHPRLAASPGAVAPSPRTTEQFRSVRQPATVVEVVDGDTVDVRLESGREVRLRLIGLNTPESVDPWRPVECFGREASARAKELLDGKRVDSKPTRRKATGIGTAGSCGTCGCQTVATSPKS